MKTELTKEQSQRLLTLGVPKEKASLILPTDSYEMEDIYFAGRIVNKEMGIK